MQTLGLLGARRPYLSACRRRYGDVVSMRTLFGPPFVVVFDPAIVGELFRAPPERACAGAANAASEPLHGRSSLLLLDGHEHLRQRRMLSPPFHGERMRAYEDVMREAADRAIDSWPVGEPFALMPSMHSLTLDVIMRAVFGVGEEDREGFGLEARVREMLETSAGPRFERHRRAVSDLLRAEIAGRRRAADLKERADVLSNLIAAGAGDSARSLSDDELHDELITLLVAGHETTANALGWALELILRDPRVRARLDETLAAGDHGYLDAVIKETLRLRPVVTGLGRMVRTQPLRVGRYEIAPGIEVTPSIETIHADPASYPDPAAFRPERFLNGGAPATSWLPYGGGTRRCLGASFASFEMRVVLARILRRSHLRPVGRSWPRLRRGVTPPTRPAFARALRRGRRKLPARGARVMQVMPPDRHDSG